MKIIDIMKDLADGKKVPKFEVHGEKFCVGQDGYLQELYGSDVEWYIFDEWLNEEVQILEEVEDKEYENIEEITLDDWAEITYKDSWELLQHDFNLNARTFEDKINALIRNQKYILERLEDKK